MSLPKRTFITWNELSYTLSTNGNWDAFNAERDAYLAEQIAAGKTDSVPGSNPVNPADRRPLTDKVQFTVTRSWADEESANACLQFFQGLAAKYGAASCYVSGVVADINSLANGANNA